MMEFKENRNSEEKAVGNTEGLIENTTSTKLHGLKRQNSSKEPFSGEEETVHKKVSQAVHKENPVSNESKVRPADEPDAAEESGIPGTAEKNTIGIPGSGAGLGGNQGRGTTSFPDKG